MFVQFLAHMSFQLKRAFLINFCIMILGGRLGPHWGKEGKRGKLYIEKKSVRNLILKTNQPERCKFTVTSESNLIV